MKIYPYRPNVPMLTVEDVKRDLPNVVVRHHRKLFEGKLSGRKNRFATVSIGYSSALGRWIDFEFSWDSVVNALNNVTPLRAD